MKNVKLSLIKITGSMVLALGILLCISWQKPLANKLENTRWKGYVNAPGPLEATLNFKKDSVLVSAGSMVIETMAYQTKDDILTLKKLDGNSPCSTEEGQYKYLIKNDVLTLIVVNDACEARVAAFSPEGYKKQ